MLLSRSFGAGLAAVFLLSMGASSQAQHGGLSLSADDIIQKAVEKASDARPAGARPGYTYTKVNVTEELDSRGQVKQRKQRVFQVSFRAGATSVKLLQVDGHRPAQSDVKFQAETQSSAQQLLGRPATGEENRQSILTAEVVARFDFALLGESTLNGRATYQIGFRPKSPAPPVRKLMDRLLNRISGTLWIDSEEFEIARADLQLDSEVDFLGGLIGCLHKLAYTMTRIRVADGIWLHSFSSGDFEGRKLLDPMRIKTKSESTGFRFLAANNG